MSVTVGIIAEEKNDVDVLYELTCKLISEDKFSFHSFRAHGCGKFRRKCSAWAKNLLIRGCSHLVVIHDLDNNDESMLRRELYEQIKDFSFSCSLILIPIHEIEAWLLSDDIALQRAFNMRKVPKVPRHPESIQNPKELLRNIVWKSCKKNYINTIHNQRIARFIRIITLKVCPSFSSYPPFVHKHLAN